MMRLSMATKLIAGSSPSVTKPGCIEWRRAKQHNGYGRTSDGAGRVVLAHRAAWALVNGPVPPGLRVLHKCDNPPCVNPEHLFLGTSKENTADMIAKGRLRRPFARRFVDALFDAAEA